MANVDFAGKLRVAATPLGTVAASPLAAGEGIGEAVAATSGILDAGASLATKVDDDNARLEAQEKLTELNRRKRQLLHGRPETVDAFGVTVEAQAGYYSLLKKGAVDAQVEYGEKLENLIASSMEGITNNRVRDYLASPVANLRNQGLDGVAAHATQQRTEYELDVHQATVLEAHQQAVANGADRSAVQKSIKDIYDAVRKREMLTGADAKAAESAAEEATTAAYVDVLNDLRLRGAPDKAKELYEFVVNHRDAAIRRRFDTTARGEILKLITADLEAGEVNAALDRLFRESKKSSHLRHSAEFAREMRARAREVFPDDGDQRDALVSAVDRELDVIRALHKREESDHDREVLDAANALIGVRGAKLTTEMMRVMAKVPGRIPTWTLFHTRELSGDPGTTNNEKMREWIALGKDGQAALTQEELARDWLPHFATTSELTTGYTIDKVMSQWQAAQVAEGRVSAAMASAEKADRKELTDALAFQTYSGVMAAYILSLDLKVADDSKVIGDLKIRVHKDIEREVRRNGGHALQDPEVEEIINRHMIKIDFWGNEAIYTIDDRDTRFGNIPREHIDEVASLVHQQSREFDGDAPLVDPGVMRKAWDRMEDAADRLPASSKTRQDIERALTDFGLEVTPQAVRRLYIRGIFSGASDMVDLSDLLED